MNFKALLHLINEFSPVIAFFIAAQFYNFFIATGVLIVSTIIAIVVGWYFEKRVPILPLISGTFVIVSGFITISNENPDALIFADSLYYFLMGLTIAFGLLYKKNILKLIFERTFAMTDEGWSVLAHRWIVIFILTGIANEVARFMFTPEVWVNFKLLKVVAITIFGLYQFKLSKKYRIPELSNEWGIRKD
jgi:intracellular septation protein